MSLCSVEPVQFLLFWLHIKVQDLCQYSVIGTLSYNNLLRLLYSDIIDHYSIRNGL